MKVYLIIGLILVWIWILYEGWRAPGMEEDEYGNWKVVKPSKTLKDLFKKKEIKKSEGSYSDLEKYGRGRSKH